MSDELKMLYICLLKYKWHVHGCTFAEGYFHICLSKLNNGISGKCVNLYPMEKI
ncbi:hypothetical protein LCGC14_1479890 [marine sediment metagenome]|uniref:Uncharacterized protein n=1 Tax=marine sediment metagenome TaxID=412755 RepID=A0A0F9MBL5_9ZZZZ